MRISGEPGYVLHARAFGETSLIAEVLTLSHGRLGLMAKGARNSRSRRAALLQIGQPLLLSWADRGELPTLTEVEAGGPANGLRGEALFCAWYLNELLLKLMPRRHALTRLFLAYAAALPKLTTHANATLRLFELELLAALDEALILPANLDPTASYRYDWESGPHLAAAAADSALQIAGASLIALRDHSFESDALNNTRSLLQSALQRLLGRQRLETPAMLRQLRAGQ